MGTKTGQAIPLKSLHPSRFQPHGERGDIGALQHDIERRGLLQPIMARGREDGDFELIYGHRRLAAMQGLGREALTIGTEIIVRDMTDEEALEALLVENGQRLDLTPLEEAEVCRQLLSMVGDVREVASRIGKSATTVAKRVRLLALPEAARTALDKGKMTLGAAELLSTLQSEKAMVEAWRQLKGGNGAITADDARWVLNKFALRLSDANFDMADTTKPGGLCSACPKRLCAQDLLFPDAKAKDDHCLDVKCWDENVKHHSRNVVKAAKRDGAKVLDSKESAKLLGARGPRYGSGYIAVDEPYPIDTKRRTLLQLLGTKLPTIVVATDEEGIAWRLVPEKGLAEKLKEAGHIFGSAKAKGEESAKQRDARLRENPTTSARWKAKLRFEQAVTKLERLQVCQSKKLLPAHEFILKLVLHEARGRCYGPRLDQVNAELEILGSPSVDKITKEVDVYRAVVLLTGGEGSKAWGELAKFVNATSAREDATAYVKAIAKKKSK